MSGWANHWNCCGDLADAAGGKMGLCSIAIRNGNRNADYGCGLLTFILGGVAQLIWAKVSPDTEKAYRIPLASGLICGEAIIAVVLAIMAAAGVNF